MTKEIRDIIIQLLNHLPDNTTHEVETAEDEVWYYCWQELSSEAQAEVKTVRKAAEELLNHLHATEEETLYIVGSKVGYFVRFENDIPLMISDPVCASRLKIGRAIEVSCQLEELGFVGELTELRIGRPPEFFCKQCGVKIEGKNAYSTYGVDAVFCSSQHVDKYNNRWFRRFFLRLAEKRAK